MTPTNFGRLLCAALLAILAAAGVLHGESGTGVVDAGDGPVRPGLVLVRVDADGTRWFQPAPGYVWDGDPKGLAIKVRDDLRLINGLFYPAPGYEWNGDPQATGLATRLRAGLRLDGNYFYPAMGYEWAYAADGNNLEVKVRRNLRLINGLFYPAPGLEWDGDPQTNNFAVRTRSDLRRFDGLFYPAPGYDWVGDKENLVVRKACADITGFWNATEGDIAPMVVSQSGCWFRARFWNLDATILHEVTGYESGRMTVARYAPGCTTEMYGRVFLGDSGLWWTIDGTSGGCGIDGHRETRLFVRASGYERLRPLLDEHPRVVFERDLETHVREQRREATRSPAADPESARMLKDVLVRGARIAAGAIVGGRVGDKIVGSFRGTVIGGLLVPTPLSDQADRRGDVRGPGGGGGGGEYGCGGCGGKGPASTMMR